MHFFEQISHRFLNIHYKRNCNKKDEIFKMQYQTRNWKKSKKRHLTTDLFLIHDASFLAKRIKIVLHLLFLNTKDISSHRPSFLPFPEQR